jgi:hypothetical protein
MSYLTYTKYFQNKVIKEKVAGKKVRDICEDNKISVYTLYKILHMNGEMPTPSQASEGIGSEEGVEHRILSPNNNISHERLTSTWKGYGSKHCKVKHICLNCNDVFYARDRGNRTKFCSHLCRNKYRTKINSTVIICDNCKRKFRVKNSQVKHYIHCKNCRNLNLGAQSSKMSRNIGIWLSECFLVESEKSFDWFYDPKKPKGRFKLDYYLPDFNIGIEFDGEQHFKPSFTSRWESVEKVRYRDHLKDVLCKKHNIKVIRFRYDEELYKEKVLMKIYAEL